MKMAIKYFVAIAVAAIAGTGMTIYLLAHPEALEEQFVHNGPWQTSLSLGSKGAGVYEKALVAKIGLFALNKSETLYFTAFTDSDGVSLDARNTYRIEGGNLDTRWWSITVYGADNYLIPNSEKRYAYAMSNVRRGKDGSYIIYLAPTPKGANWLPSGKKAQAISLSIRLYNPSPAVYKNIQNLPLPRIIREAKS